VHDIPLPDSLKILQWGDEPHISTVNAMELHLLGACSGCEAVRE
jgi:hypothetical protein